MSDRRHILITNDDGIDADALLPLSEALEALGDVDVIVPERNWSGASHSITLFRPLRVRSTKLRNGHAAFMTDGSPTDCVRLAVLGFLKHRPDIVVSGINRGANMGDDITYSRSARSVATSTTAHRQALRRYSRATSSPAGSRRTRCST